MLPISQLPSVESGAFVTETAPLGGWKGALRHPATPKVNNEARTIANVVFMATFYHFVGKSARMFVFWYNIAMKAIAILSIASRWCMALAAAAVAIALSALSIFAQEREEGDDVDETDPGENRNYGTPDLPEITREERTRAIRELKRVERRSKAFRIFLNRGKMEKLKGDRLLKVLKEYDRFVSVLEELPEGFVKARAALRKTLSSLRPTCRPPILIRWATTPRDLPRSREP